ncbi:MAG: uroporphyrinogen decarboxylase family protein [Planctomycetota bacterium]
MTSWERVLLAMRRRTPDRPPFALGLTPALMAAFKEKAGDVPLQEYFGMDVAQVDTHSPPRPPAYAHWYEGRTLKEGTTFDMWGVAHEPGSMYHFTHYVSPLAGRPASEVRRYELPDCTNPACFEDLAEDVAALHEKGFPVTGFAGHTYETAWQIRGSDDFLRDMVLDPDPIEELVERITCQNVVVARELAKAGVDVLRCGDDVANQNALMFSPILWRRFFKARLKRVMDAAREVNPDILTWYHSDGKIEALIPELIEIGLDILNPVQPECMDLRTIKERYGDRLAFWGCIGTQSTMPFGTADQVRDTVRQTIALMGPGLFVAPTHVLEPEVPWANIEALVETVKAYRY